MWGPSIRVLARDSSEVCFFTCLPHFFFTLVFNSCIHNHGPNKRPYSHPARPGPALTSPAQPAKNTPRCGLVRLHSCSSPPLFHSFAASPQPPTKPYQPPAAAAAHGRRVRRSGRPPQGVACDPAPRPRDGPPQPRAPPARPQPLILHGPRGVGKSTLLLRRLLRSGLSPARRRLRRLPPPRPRRAVVAPPPAAEGAAPSLPTSASASSPRSRASRATPCSAAPSGQGRARRALPLPRPPHRADTPRGTSRPPRRSWRRRLPSPDAVGEGRPRRVLLGAWRRLYLLHW